MIDDSQLDMLVDGELDETERRQVLSDLDTEPNGWRRCALAFLEAQSWRHEMRTLPRDATAETAAVRSASRPSRQRFRTAMAMAASFLLALGLGLAIDDMGARDAPLAPPMQLAEVQLPEEPNNSESPIVPLPDQAPESSIPYQYVSIPARDPVSGKTDAVRMPVVPQEWVGNGWPQRLPSALPDNVVQSLRQQGHNVFQNRRLVPYEARDGSRVVFPVDEVELVPVANRGYQ